MAQTEQDLREKIDNLKAILASGATETVRDGHVVRFDHTSIRKEIVALQQELDELLGNTKRNRLFYRVNLNSNGCS